MDLIYLPIIIFTIIILTYVSFQDIKYREINIMSLVFLSIVSLIYLGFFVFEKEFLLWKNYFIQIGITFLFVLVFYVLGKISYYTYIGEGDLYTILALSFTNIFNLYFPLFIFFFALLLTLFVPFLIFIYNLVFKNYPKYKFFPSIYLMFLGYPLNINKLTKFYSPLEKYYLKNNKLHSSIIYKPNVEPDNEINYLKKISKKNNLKYIWVSPLIPFIILIFISYIFVVFLYFFDYFKYLLALFI
jgi:hypothetical protein